MRTSLILGLKHGAKHVQVIGAPLPPDEQNRKFKALVERGGDGFHQIHLHELALNSGRKRYVFRHSPAKADDLPTKHTKDAAKKSALPEYRPHLTE